MKSLAKLMLLASLPLFAEDISYSTFTVKHIESGGVGYDMGYTTFQAFLSADPDWWAVTPFLDARGHVLDNGRWAANAGIGIRRFWGDRAYGLNTYYDYRNTSHLNYNQIGVGLETLGQLVDARINGYFPLGQTLSSPYNTQFSSFYGHSMILSQKREFAMTGADAEIGFHAGRCNSLHFYGAIGPYYYRGPIGGNAWGGKARVSMSYKQYVSCEVIESYDNVFHNHVQGQIAFSLPLGGKEKKPKKKRACLIAQPVARSEIVVLDHKNQYPTAINPDTGAPYYFVFVDNTSASAGTYESPYHSLAQAQANSSANDILYIFPGDGTTTNMDQGIVLKTHQKLWGSSVSHNLTTTEGAVTIPSMSASAPKITNTVLLGAGVTLSTRNEVSGLTIQNTSGQGIKSTNPESCSISFCTLKNCGIGDLGLDPIFIQTSIALNANFYNNIFTDNPNTGAYILLNSGTSAATISFTHNQASDNLQQSGEHGLLTINPNTSIDTCNVYVANNTATNNTGVPLVSISNIGVSTGSFSTFTGVFSNNIATDGGLGISYKVNAGTCSISITDNNLSNNASGSVFINAGSGRITHLSVYLDNNQMNNASAFGSSAVDLSALSDTFSGSITNNSISNNNSSGILIYNGAVSPPSISLTIANNTISNNTNVGANAAGGISIDGFSALDCTISNNRFSNNTNGNKIGTYGGSTSTPSGNTSLTVLSNTLTEGDVLEFNSFTPAVACLSISGNTSTTSPTYLFYNIGSGTGRITPCNYTTINTGDFDTFSVVSAPDCSGGTCD